MATQRDGFVRGGSLVWALRRAWELPPELCKLTALFWESPHSQNYRRRVMMELEALCVRVALMASCSLSKARIDTPDKPFSSFKSFSNPRVWETTFAVPDPDNIPVFHLPLNDVVSALDARVRQLPFLWRYNEPVCHPQGEICQGKCSTCGEASLLDDWAKFPEAYPDSQCARHMFARDRLETIDVSHVFARVWQLCHAGGTGTSAEQIAEESGTIEDALKRSGCLLNIQFEHECHTFPTTHVLSVTVTETIRSIKPFEQIGVECLRDAARHPKRTPRS